MNKSEGMGERGNFVGMTSVLGNSRRADITFHKSGQIDITARVSKALGLRAGDVLDVVTGGGECYLRVKHRAGHLVGRHEAQVYPTSKAVRRCNNMRCHSKRLTDAVLKMCHADDTVRLHTGEMTQAGLPLITRVNNNAR